ncbi:unnamed protein product [Nippostrongylus brasiliensis]|uniref:Protein kinase domain-containing protein n=1 Tax=Nippostrongylus brasiliensis TaxID=27835 RepID=A0A0N4XVD9_NIPBR|nr:unnamed protein product [Nippostrongylus brasiliensis]
MDDEEEEDVALKPGSVIESSKGAYVVMKLLGEGGFGAVYRVHDQKNILQEYAMKVEKKVSGRRHSKLKMEVEEITNVLTSSNHTIGTTTHLHHPGPKFITGKPPINLAIHPERRANRDS